MADPGAFVGALVARWAARLSALLIRGNAAVVRHAQGTFAAPLLGGAAGEAFALPHCLPEGACAYELLCLLLGADLRDLEEEVGEEAAA